MMSSDSSVVPSAAAGERPRLEPLTSPFATVVVVTVLVGLSLAGAGSQAEFVTRHGRIVGYAYTAGFEWLMFAGIWFALRRNHRTVREVIGGRWASPEDFLIDVAIAAGFWLLSLAVLAGVAYALGMVQPENLNAARKATDFLMPHTAREAALWPLLTLTAGFCEEFIYRGYLQRQFGAYTHSAWLGMILSSIVFGLSHGYQGPKLMLVITVFGMLFAMLAHFRKSLRPGMMTHAWQDSLSGLVRYLRLV